LGPLERLRQVGPRFKAFLQAAADVVAHLEHAAVGAAAAVRHDCGGHGTPTTPEIVSITS
jgi:hypothetical protein